MVKLAKFESKEMVVDPKSIRHSAQTLKQRFLDNAQPLLDEYINAALGLSELQSTSLHAREEVWGVLKQLMLNSSDRLDIDINSAEDVLEAVSKGKCTFAEADKLLDMYKKMKEIDNVGVTAGSAPLGFTINVLGSQQVEPIEIKPQVIEHE